MSNFIAPRRRRHIAAAAACAALATPLALTPTAAEAHAQPGLSATVLGVQVSCPFSDRICVAEGRVRVNNRRPLGTGAIVICVGVDVHTPGHRSLSLEPPLPGGQAVIRLRPGRSGIAAYRTVFDAAAGVANHVHVTHVHKHIVHGPSGRQC